MNSDDVSSSGIDSDLLRTFVAVANHGNVTRAARALARTQSAISVQVRRLEDTLGTRLFERQARGVALTWEGERLLAAARPLLADLRRLQELFGESLSGRVRVGVPDDYGSGVLESILARFNEQHPNVEVSVRCGFSLGFPRAVDTGELDIAVYARAPDDPQQEEIFSEPTVWAARADWSTPSREPVLLALFDRDCWWRDCAVEALQRSGRSWRVAFSSESVAGVKAAVSAGLAVGVLARSTLAPGMRVLTPSEGFPALPESTLVLLRNPDTAAAVIDAMADAIRQGFTPAAVPM